MAHGAREGLGLRKILGRAREHLGSKRHCLEVDGMVANGNAPSPCIIESEERLLACVQEIQNALDRL